MTSETLAPDIGWEPSGHLSEVALSALSDGEEALLDAAMHQHLDACEACAVRLGGVALRLADVGEALSLLGAPARAPVIVTPVIVAPVITPVIAPGASGSAAPRAVRRKVPVAVIGAALAVALIGAAPALLTLPADAAQTASVLRKVLPSFMRLLPMALGKLWHGPTGAASVVVVWSLSLALVAIGFGIAKKASKKTMADGGRR